MELPLRIKESAIQLNVMHVKIQTYNTITTNLVKNYQNLVKNRKPLLLITVLRENAKPTQIVRKDSIVKVTCVLINVLLLCVQLEQHAKKVNVSKLVEDRQKVVRKFSANKGRNAKMGNVLINVKILSA